MTPITLTEIIYGFPQSLQAHAWLVPEIRSWLFLNPIHQSLFIIPCDTTVWVTDSAMKEAGSFKPSGAHNTLGIFILPHIHTQIRTRIENEKHTHTKSLTGTWKTLTKHTITCRTCKYNVTHRSFVPKSFRTTKIPSYQQMKMNYNPKFCIPLQMFMSKHTPLVYKQNIYIWQFLNPFLKTNQRLKFLNLQ